VNIERFVHPNDRELAKGLHQKETMLKNLEGRKTYSYKYRIMVDGQPRFFLFTLKLADDGRSFVLYEKDIEDDIKAEAMRQEAQKKQVTFSQIAESLAANYDVIYYVDAEDSSYISFECRNIYGQLDARKSGDDYYADSLLDIPQIVHPGDRDLVFDFLDKERMASTFKDKKSDSIEYRVVAGDITHYVRLTVRKTSDGTHYIIGIENIDAEIQREKQHLRALKMEKELARRDELTGVKNKTAYHELEKSVQENIDNGLDYLDFALVVCDSNNLKRINDTEGHVVGDEYIKQSAKLLCDIFVHSPVFRVGGDEFVIFLRSNDFTNRNELMKRLRDQVLENLKSGSGPILASGMADYIPETDHLVSEIFERADKEMYEDKQTLKKKESG
jgi:diguanylate cyclase (GGDEF)-like protein